MTLNLFNSAPSFTNVTNGQTIFVNENTTFVLDANATDPNGDTLTFSIVGGADAARFTIDPVTGVLRFRTAPDFEGENSAIGNDDIYDVTIRVSDGKGGVHDKSIFVQVVDVPEPTGVVDGEETAENMVLGYDDSNAPSNGGGDRITTGADSIDGNGGNDTIDASGGNDFVTGGEGADSILGGEGNDTLVGDGTIGSRVVGGPNTITPVSGANYTLLTWQLRDITVAGTSTNPFPDSASGASTFQIAGGTFTINSGAQPIAVGITDGDRFFDDGDLSQVPPVTASRRNTPIPCVLQVRRTLPTTSRSTRSRWTATTSWASCPTARWKSARAIPSSAS